MAEQDLYTAFVEVTELFEGGKSAQRTEQRPFSEKATLDEVMQWVDSVSQGQFSEPLRGDVRILENKQERMRRSSEAIDKWRSLRS